MACTRKEKMQKKQAKKPHPCKTFGTKLQHAYFGTHLGHGVHPHAGPVDLDLVGVHGCVGDEDLCVLDALGLPHADLLVQDVALVKVGLLRREIGVRVETMVRVSVSAFLFDFGDLPSHPFLESDRSNLLGIAAQRPIWAPKPSEN